MPNIGFILSFSGIAVRKDEAERGPANDLLVTAQGALADDHKVGGSPVATGGRSSARLGGGSLE